MPDPFERTCHWPFSQILKCSFLDNVFKDSVAEWEDDIFMHEKDAQSSLLDDVKIAIMMSETMGARQTHLRFNAMGLKSCSDVKQVVMNYFRSRQMFQGSASSGTAPMDVAAFWKRQ